MGMRQSCARAFVLVAAMCSLLHIAAATRKDAFLAQKPLPPHAVRFSFATPFLLFLLTHFAHSLLFRAQEIEGHIGASLGHPVEIDDMMKHVVKQITPLSPRPLDPVDLVYLWVNGSDPVWLRAHDETLQRINSKGIIVDSKATSSSR